MRRLFLLRGILTLVLSGGVGSAGVWAKTVNTADVDTVASDNNDFATDLYAQLAPSNEGNLFFSPYSITTVLAMTYNGARGQTATQMSQVLHFTLGNKQQDAGLAALSGELDNSSKVHGARVYDLALANSLWVQIGFPFKNTFIQTVQRYFGAEIQRANFAKNADQAVEKIDNWVAEKTGDLIQDLIPQGGLPANTRLVLVNAIYFQGKWASAFDPSQTTDQPFHVDAQNDDTVAMMNQTEAIPYLENDQLQMAELPYVGDKLSMVVLLPAAVDGLADLEANLTADQLNKWIGQMSSTAMGVSLPKFQMTSQFELSDALSTMGMPAAFSSKADFSGMSNTGGLQIGSVIHKAFVDVSETGTKAAAATEVGVGILARTASPAFVADHPFIFVIRDRTSGAILFMGRVTDPSQQ
jgi:serine protease inhibitor